MAGVQYNRNHGLHIVFLLVLAIWLPNTLLGQELIRPGGGNVGNSAVGEPEDQQVVDVRVVGHRHMSLQKIRPHIHTRKGRPLKPEMVEEDVRRLNRSKMFVNVKTYLQQVDHGVVVIFEVLERPMLNYVKYVGNQTVKKQKLAKEVRLKAGDAADPYAVEEARRHLLAYYHSHGFPEAQVSIHEGNQPTDRGVIFLINEGPKKKILWTRFIGNTIATDARLRTKIQSKPGLLWLFKGDVDHNQIDEDVRRLTAHYRSLGYFQAKVGAPLMDYNKDRDWLTLTFVIDEGIQSRIGKISFIGNTIFSNEELAKKTELKAGQYFNQFSLSKDQVAITYLYGGKGHAFADVKVETRYFEEPGTIDLVYDIQEGQQIRVGRINVAIAGEYPHTRLAVVLNRLSVKSGDILDIRKLKASERRLQASQLFEVDPRNGTAPKIVFSPPSDMSNVKNIAKRPSRPPGFRGQSPDPDSWTFSRPLHRIENVRYLDLTIEGKLRDSTEPRVSPSLSPQSPPSVQSPSTGVAVRRPPNNQRPDYNQRPAHNQRSPSNRDSDIRFQHRDMDDRSSWVIRGQYDSDAGYASPPPSAPTPTRMPHAGSGVYPIAPPPGGWSAPGTASYPEANRTPMFPNGVVPAQYLPNKRYPELNPQWGRPPDEDPFLIVPISPEVAETRTGRITFSVGVNSDAGLLGSMIIDEQNFDLFRWPRDWYDIRNGTAFRGGGQRLRLEAVPGTQVQRYTITFQEPYLYVLNEQFNLGLSGFFYNRRYREWDEERLGGRISLGYRLTHDLSLSFAFRGSRVEVYNPIRPGIADLEHALGKNSLFGFGLKLAHDTRNNAFLPSEGHLFEMGVEQVIGTHEYTRANLDLRKYFLLHQRPDDRSGRHVLGLTTRTGYTSANTPVYDHFFAGGFSTLRGFDFRAASPRDQGVIVGGHFQLLASAEYIFPLTADDMLQGVIFCDTGTVQPSIDDWSDKYRVVPGFGLRITIPAMSPAPIALDFGFPVVREEGDDVQVFSFSGGLLR